MEYHGILGGPITCLLIAESLFCGQGGYLCRFSLNSPEEERWRLMRDCDALHGIVQDTNQTLICFGGRELHRVTTTGEILVSKRTRDWILALTVHDQSLYVGCLHTDLQLRCAKTLTLQRTIVTSGIFQTLYCMDLLHREHTIHAAAGTSHQTVLVWSDEAKPKELVGHQGAIHAVRWNNHSTLVSASDDRTVRLWELSTSSLVWTAYGHTARIWDVVMLGNTVASAGEDGTVRLWGASDGELLHTYRTSACVWRLAGFDAVLLAALNTGGIAMLDLNLPRRHAVQIPEDRVFPIHPPNEGKSPTNKPKQESKTCKKQEKKTLKMTDQVVFGISLIDSTTMLLATRCGSFWQLKGGSVESVFWKHKIPADGSCMAVMGQSIAMGTKTGFIQLHTGTQCDGSEHRSVHRMEWLDEQTLIAFHSTPGRATVWCATDESLCIALRAAVNGIGISCALKSKHVVVGDTRGNLALFDVSLPETDNERESVSILRKVHGKEHVTDMVWTKTHLYTVGNDGCLVMVKVNLSNATMVRLVSLPLRDFTGLRYVWSLQNRIVVGGYVGNDFAIVGVDDSQEYCRLDTGGRQRSLSLNAPAFSSEGVSDAITVGVLRRTNKGGNVMDVWHFGSVEQPSHSQRRLIGHMLHSETVFDASAFSLGKESFVLVTASEDCSAKLTIYQKGTVVAVHTLPCQSSGVRAVSTTTFQTGTAMVVIGGKLELKFYLANQIELPDSILELRESGCSRPTNCLDIDHRINAISTAQPDEAQNSCLVVCGSSNGMCYSLDFTDHYASPMRPFFQDKRPILSTSLLSLEGNNFLCFIGTSAGVVRLFRLSLDQRGQELISPLLSIASHSVGVNSITAVVVPVSEYNQTTSIHVFSGGDDQAVVAHRIAVHKSHDTLQLETTSRVENAGSSAIRGVASVGVDHFLSVGYDQQLKLWSWKDKQLVLCNVLSSSVGDINCLAFCASESIAAVCGAAVETFRVRGEVIDSPVQQT